MTTLFEHGILSWRKILAGSPEDNRMRVFANAAGDIASYVTKGFPRITAADELTEMASAYGLASSAGVDAIQEVISRAFENIEEPDHVPDDIDPLINGKGSPLPAGITTKFPYPIKGSTIPRRPWLLPGLLLRRQLTLMVAPPGSGKSLLTMQLGMICTAGISDWHGWRPRGRYRVLIINSEEDEDEMLRRLYAARHRMNIPDELLGGFAIASSQEGIVVARADSRTKTVTRTPLLEAIIETVKAQHFDIIIVDPFAETFAGDENSNSELKWAGVLWREVARRTNAAVLLVHHTRKYAADMAGDPDAGRGGGALTGIARIVCTVFPMSSKEAESLGVPALDRTRYIRFDDAKANQSLITLRARWFFKMTFQLPNAGANEPADDVGVLEPWYPKDPLAEMDDNEVNQILRELDAGVKDEDGRSTGDPYLLTRRGRGGGKNWAGRVLQRFHSMTDQQAGEILGKWVSNNLIEERAIVTTASKGREVQGIKVLARVGTIEQELMDFAK